MAKTRRSTGAKGRVRERLIASILEDALEHRSIQTAYSLSKVVGCTLSYAHAYENRLAVSGLLERGLVTNPVKLIEHWLTIREEPRPVDFFVPNPVGAFAPAPALPYAVTTYVAESQVHRYLSPSRWDVYIDGADLSNWGEHLRGHGALRGPGNFRLLIGDPWIARNPSHGYQTRSPDGSAAIPLLVPEPRLIVDLLAEGGRAKDAAELILQRKGWAKRTHPAKPG